jgi:hypothetical protein
LVLYFDGAYKSKTAGLFFLVIAFVWVSNKILEMFEHHEQFFNFVVVLMNNVMKKTLVILLVFLISVAAAQEPLDASAFPAPSGSDSVFVRPFGAGAGMMPYNSGKKVSVRMEVGSTFGFSSGAGQLFGIYTAPHISYKVSDRWRLNVGARIQNTNFLNYYNPYNPYFPEFTQTFDNNITQTMVYAESEYLVNPRLIVSTRVFKEVSVFDQPQINPRALDLNSEGVSVGFNYRITEHLQFGAEFGYSKGRNPYNPWHSTMNGFPGRSHYGIKPMTPFFPGF